MFFTRSLNYAFLILCIGATIAQSQTAATTSKPEDQVAQVERDWLAADAKGDAAALRRIISDDFVGSSFDGGVLNRADIIPENGAPGGFAGATLGETNVRVFGDTGVIMGVITPASGSQGQKIHVALVCQKRPQGWQIIAAELTQMH
jgi:ketosteroid isomerase-like protein